jgi:hypothetical protein
VVQVLQTKKTWLTPFCLSAVHMSMCPHYCISLALNTFSWNFVLGVFIKTCLSDSVAVKIWQFNIHFAGDVREFMILYLLIFLESNRLQKKLWRKSGHTFYDKYEFLKIWCVIDVIFVPGNYGRYVNTQELIRSQRHESWEFKQEIKCYAFCQPHYSHVFILWIFVQYAYVYIELMCEEREN